MKSWPWMKDIALAIADPIAPVCEEDTRPSVKDLIQEQRSIIDQIRQELANDEPILYDPKKHDDLWILRFLLSHLKKPKAAVRAAKLTLQFRHKHELDELDIRPYPPGPLARCESFQRYFACCTEDALSFDIPDPKRGVVTFLSAAGFDFHKLLQTVEFEDRLKTFCYVNEWTHQWLDYITRTTGRLTKAIRLVDSKGVALSQLSYEGLRLDGKAMCIMQDYYPQLLQCFYICDPPSWAHIPWSIMRPLLPRRIVQKIDFIAPKKSKKERKRLAAHVVEDHLPVHYGGQRGAKTVPVFQVDTNYSREREHGKEIHCQ